MSYLDIPRIHISGQFFTDPSTVNNDPKHYTADCTNPSPWQEPTGEHKFQWVNCTVKSAVDAQGIVNNDTLIGSTFSSNLTPDDPRIVDIDVYQQGVSTIYGMKITITLTDNDKTSVTGTMDCATLNSLWLNSVLPTRSWNNSDYGEDSYGGDMNACGCFQTVVRFDAASWKQTSSTLLNQLFAATIQVNSQYLLSFKFVVDGFQNVPQDISHNMGRMIATLGPVFENEPLYNPGQRWLLPRAFSTNDPWNYPSFNESPFKVDKIRKKLVIDLGNSICRQSAGGPPVDIGTLNAMISTPGVPPVSIGLVDCSAFAYDGNAQVTELPLTDAQLDLLETGGLQLVMSRTDLGVPEILAEAAGVPVFAVEIRPVRMEGIPGTTFTTRVFVSLQGNPLANKQLDVHVESVHGNTPGATVPPDNPGDTPDADGALQAVITPTDETGFATVTLTVVKNPKMRTPELDGQLYFINVYDPEQPVPDWAKDSPVQEHLISCLVWSEYPVNTNPGWPEIQSMMQPYMKLYPGMKSRIDLTNLDTFTLFSQNPPWSIVYKVTTAGPLGINSGAIPFYLSRDINDTRYMPISRDLSPGKLMTVMYFIKNLQDAGQTPTT